MGKNYGYRKYMKNDEQGGGMALKIFLTSFFAMLIVFAIMAKNFSPQVDTTIGNSVSGEEEVDDENSRTSIDQRLVDIQNDDRTGALTDKDIKSPIEKAKEAQSIWSKKRDEVVQDEKVTIPKFHSEILVSDNNPFKPQAQKQNQENDPLATTNLNTQTQSQTQTYVYKVYVGYYTNIEQARVAQGILLDTNLGLNPFVKDIGNGNFALQVGAFTTRDKAQILVNQLMSNHFPARIIQE